MMKQSMENETSAFNVKFMEKRISAIEKKISAMTGIASNRTANSHYLLDYQQQSHNCQFNVDRLKRGPVDWTQIKGSRKLFTDDAFPPHETMLSWKEYPRTVGGLGKYLNWFKGFQGQFHDYPPVSFFWN